MNSLTDVSFPLFTMDISAHFPSGFKLNLPSLITRMITTEEFEKESAALFENTGGFKRKRDETTKRDFTARRTKNRGYAIDEMKELSEKVFKKMFRLNRRGFYYLLTRIRKHLTPNPGAVSYGIYHDILKPISPEVRLAITLRWLVGGSYLDICFAFGISTGTFFKEGYYKLII